MSTYNYSIIIPAYNESARLSASLDKLLTYAQQQNWNAEVLVVNDGSTDNTAEVIKAYTRLHPAVRLIENPGNRGKGYSVRNGMMHARGAVLLFSDADLSSPIYEAPKLFQALANGADVAIGSRWLNRELQTEKQPLLRQIYGRLFNFALRVLLGLKLKDTQCGFKAFKRRAAETIFTRQQVERWGFDPELLFIARKFGLSIAEVPVEWAHDHRSKINPLRDGIRMFFELLAVRWNDLRGRYRSPSTALDNALPDERVAMVK